MCVLLLWFFFFLDPTDALVRQFLCSAVKSKSNGSKAEKNLVQMSPMFEPFGVVPHILYIFHTSQLPSVILKRTCTVFYLLKTVCPSHAEKMKS